MLLQIIWLSTRVITLGTLVRLLTSVHSHVNLQTTWRETRVITLSTYKWLVSSSCFDICSICTTISSNVSFTPWILDLDIRRSYIVRGGFFFFPLWCVFGVLTNFILEALWYLIEVCIPRVLDNVVWEMTSELFIRCQNFFGGYQRNAGPADWICVCFINFSQRDSPI